MHYWRLPEPGLQPVEWMLECDRLNYLPDYILKKGDLCSMAHGLELRNPLLDQLFFEFVQSIPHNERFTTPPKGLLRAGLGASQAGKRGFNPPLNVWLRQPSLAEKIRQLPELLDAQTGGILHRTSLAGLTAGHRQGIIPDELIWQLLVLESSLRQFYEPPRSSTEITGLKS